MFSLAQYLCSKNILSHYSVNFSTRGQQCTDLKKNNFSWFRHNKYRLVFRTKNWAQKLWWIICLEFSKYRTWRRIGSKYLARNIRRNQYCPEKFALNFWNTTLSCVLILKIYHMMFNAIMVWNHTFWMLGVAKKMIARYYL